MERIFSSTETQEESVEIEFRMSFGYSGAPFSVQSLETNLTPKSFSETAPTSLLIPVLMLELLRREFHGAVSNVIDMYVRGTVIKQRVIVSYIWCIVFCVMLIKLIVRNEFTEWLSEAFVTVK